MDKEKINGIYIVSARENNSTEFRKFNEFINDKDPIPTIRIDNLPEVSKNDVGEEVTTKKGDLVKITFFNKVAKKGLAFNLANVGPNDERGAFQYAVALHKLGMRDSPVIRDQTYLVVDGNFRKVN